MAGATCDPHSRGPKGKLAKTTGLLYRVVDAHGSPTVPAQPTKVGIAAGRQYAGQARLIGNPQADEQGLERTTLPHLTAANVHVEDHEGGEDEAGVGEA